MKTCPYCAEEIQKEAIKCKHCGSNLLDAVSNNPKEETKPSTPPKPENILTREINVGDSLGVKLLVAFFLLVMGAAFGAVVWYLTGAVVIIWFVAKKTKLQKWKKILISIVVLVIASIFVSQEADLNASPVLNILEPANGYSIQATSTIIRGTVSPGDTTLFVNRERVHYENGEFSHSVALPNETNIFEVSAINPRSDKQTVQKISIIRLYSDDEKEEAERIMQEKIAEEKAREAERQAKIDVENAEWLASKPGKICADKPTWTKEECRRVAEGKIWIGMHLDMLKYNRGLPDSANPSNYGYGTDWQWCWHNYTPSCFYDDNEDGIIDSYN